MKVGDIYARRYVVVKKLGWGHFSTVWMARDEGPPTSSAAPSTSSTGGGGESAEAGTDRSRSHSSSGRDTHYVALKVSDRKQNWHSNQSPFINLALLAVVCGALTQVITPPVPSYRMAHPQQQLLVNDVKADNVSRQLTFDSFSTLC